MRLSLTLYHILALVVSLATANDPIITRDYVWRNFQDFIDYGWVEQYKGTTKNYSTPSELDTKLYNLNSNFNDEVWGWSVRNSGGRTSMTYSVNIGTKPEYCGMINATISFKYYLEGTAGAAGYGTYVYPACTTSSSYPNQCYVSNSNFATWASIRQNVVLTRSKTVQMTVRLNSAGLILMDEVRLTYAVQQGVSCPYSCSSDCDYRGIDCHNYYTCIDRKYKEFRTCDKSDGLAFHPITKSCDLIENVEGCNRPKPPPPPQCVCEFRPHERDCSRYYYCPDTCHEEECEERQCPSGLLWSMDAKGDGSGQQQCAPPSKAECHNNETMTTPEPTQTTHEPTESTTKLPQTTLGPIETSTAPIETSTAPIETSTAPIETSTAPIETSTAPIETSTAPIETSTAPIETSTAPIETSVGPIETSVGPIETSTAPIETSTGPETTPKLTDKTLGPTETTTEEGTTLGFARQLISRRLNNILKNKKI